MSKEVVLAVLARATEDPDFYGNLAQDFASALGEYDLTFEEVVAIGTGDVRWIESHTGGKIDQQSMEKVLIPLLSRERW